MSKKLRILSGFLFIIGTIVFIGVFGAVITGFAARRDQTIASTPTPAKTAISTRTALPAPAREPTNPASTPTNATAQLDATPTCFTPLDLIPFAFLPDNSAMLVRSNSGVQIFNLKSGALQAFIRSSKNVISAALSPDGQTLAWSLDDNTIQLVQISDQKVLQTLSGHTDMVGKLSFTPDGNLLVSASHDYWVKVWNLQGEELHGLQAGQVLGIAISPDGSTLATVPSDGPVSLWSLDRGEKIKDLGGTGGYDTSDAEFSPDGKYLVADLMSGLFLWRISDASLVWNEVKNSMAATFSPDGQYLAYSNIDKNNEVVLADPDTGQFIRVLGKMQSPVWELFFSPDSSMLAVTDGVKIHVWRVEDGTLLSVGKSNCP